MSGSIVASGVLISQPCVVKNLCLLAGSDAATAKFYDNQISVQGENPKWALGAGTGLSAQAEFPDGLRFKDGVYVVLTGTAPTAFAAIEAPGSSQPY